METPHTVVTGGASGLGLGCAERFLALGHRVTLADVNVAAGAAAARGLAARFAGRCRFEPIDLADAAAIAAFAARLAGERVDVLVNNAGIYPPSRRALTVDGQERTFAIAHLGHFRLTHALWPALAAAPAARVVSVSSLVQRRARLDPDNLGLDGGYTPIRAYAQAKVACLLFARELDRRLVAAGSAVRSRAAHPGVVRTGLGRHRAIVPGDAWHQRLATRALALGLSRIGQSPAQAAAAIVAAATTAELPVGAFLGPTGPLEAFGAIGPIATGPAAADPALAAALWARSEALTGLRWTF